ncbi:MAG: AI-2E family transporter [Piscinibacter sp.]|nr:AI-2E family transporter [Piscinibacter sp.]
MDTPSPDLPERPRSSAAATLLAALALAAALWWGQRFLVPVTAGVLLALLLVPLVPRGQHLLRSRVAATLAALSLALAVLVGGGAAFGGQLLRVAERVPEMMSLAAWRMVMADSSGGTLLRRVRTALHDLDRAAERLGEPAPPPRARPARVQRTVAAPAARQSEADSDAETPAPFTEGAAEALRSTAISGPGLLMRLAGELAIVLFVAFFLLTGGAPLTHRFLDLWSHSASARQRATAALAECTRQVRLYAGVLLVTNTAIGLAVWAAFAWLGLPDAGGWGVAAAVLHVVPYLGMALLTALGAAEAFLAHGTLASAFGVAAFVVLLSTLVGTLVTAWLQGRAARMSPAAVFIGLVLWGALWGVWGLFLGPLLIVLVKVVAEHSRSARPLARLMEA